MHRIALFLMLAFAAGVAQAQTQSQDIPKRKSGLWEVTKTSTRTSGSTRVLQWCVDEKTDNALMQLAEGGRSEKCKVGKMQREGDKLIVDAVCTIGEQKIEANTHAVITGNFESAYKIESSATYAHPVRGRTEGTAVLAGRWVSACKPGQKPGDIILPSGAKFNPSQPGSGSPPKTPITPRRSGQSAPPAPTAPTGTAH
ncbi:MAG TPA: DUF3617 family protein [Casimicrobiaceae bacterium]|nr:DUF3617 family protein [Casimicrobiaceae bacterium]